MSTLADLAADRAAITDLVNRYALHIRHGDSGLAAGLFCADGVFEVREWAPGEGPVSVRGRAEGREAVADYVSNSTRAARMIPMIHNLIVELDGDSATASSLMVGRIWPTANEVTGEYADSFRREADGWRFAERIYTIWRAG